MKPRIERMYAVTSSMVTRIGYDYATSTLRVEFSNGEQYDYDNITPQHWAELTNAPSIGKAFHVIRNNEAKFPSRKLKKKERTDA